MALFDAPRSNYPVQWKEFSLDNKLGFVYFGCMTAMWVSGDGLSIKQELLAAMFLVAILTTISLRYRHRMNWRWPGVQTKGVLTVVGILVLAGIFEFASAPLFSPSDPRILPWHLAALGGAVFGVLVALRIVQLSKSDFLKQCEAVDSADFHAKASAETIPVVPTDPLWKRVTRGVFYILFVLAWLEFVAFFYFSGVAFRNGSPKPAPTQTDPLSDHGQIVYIQHSQKARIDFLENVASIGMPSVMACGFILHFLLGVSLFPGMPTLQERRKQKQKK